MAAVNDATKQKIGDIYQYFIALFDCFSLKKGESMLIETEGDVSIVSHSGQNRIQKEIKHHLGKRNLSDRDEDFWNTLDNWCKNKHSTATFEKLIFYTTSGISKNSAFYNWNTVDTDARYRLLKDCGEERRMRESSFRQHYDNIFSANTLTQKELMDILGKIEIWSDQSVISEIDQIFAEASRHIPLENRRLYIEFLLGHIMAKVADPPHKWHVSFDDFEQMVIDATGRFAKSDHVYLPSDTGGEPSPEDCAALQEKVFVKEIERIEYDQVIHSAIDDYWRTHTQVLRSAQSNTFSWPVCRHIKTILNVGWTAKNVRLLAACVVRIIALISTNPRTCTTVRLHGQPLTLATSLAIPGTFKTASYTKSSMNKRSNGVWRK